MNRFVLFMASAMPAILFLCAGYGAASDIRSLVDARLDSLPSLLVQDPSGSKAQNYLRNNSLLYPIQNYFYDVPGTLTEHSHDRQQRVLEVEGILNRHEKIILDVTRASFAQGNGETSTIRLLPFFPQSAAIKDTLFTIVREPTKNQEFAIQSYDAIFMLQLDDADLRGEMVNFINTNRNQKTTSAELAGGLYSASARWGAPEMQEIYQSDIETPIHPDNYIYGNNRQALIANIVNAARGLDYYGKMPENYIAALEARIKELDLKSGDEQNALSQFKKTIAILRGDREPEFAVSWKGQLLGISNETYRKWFGHDREIKSAAAFDRRPPSDSTSTLPVSSSITPVQQPKSVTSPPPIVQAESPKSSPLPWVIGAFLLLALVGGILFKFLRR
jgi:hypothetical protein